MERWMIRFVFGLLGVGWQAVGTAVMFNSHLGEVKHLEGVIMALLGLVVIVILLEKDEG